MKATRLLIALLLIAAVVGTADAQGYKRLSWDGCDPQIPNKMWDGPHTYTMVVSAIGLTEPMVGHDSKIIVTPPGIADAWRFDFSGCQTDSYISFSDAGLPKMGCPPLTGNAPLGITAFIYDYETTTATIRLANTYDTLIPDPAQRYALWLVTFDHQYSVLGPSDPGLTCGGVGGYLLFELNTDLLLLSGTVSRPPTQPGDMPVTWNVPPVPTVPATWGKVKGLYR